MLWLIAHMWFLLSAAFIAGIGIGWWIWGARSEHAPAVENEDALGTLESDGVASE